MPGMRTFQVAAETAETAHTWQRRMPQRAMPGMRTVQVAAETPESAHTWQQRASAMGKRRSCDGRPHRAVQNQAFCCTGRPRRTVRCRKWPCGVREARLSIGGCARRWQQEQVRRKVRLCRPEKSLPKKVNFYGSEVLSGDAVRPGKNAARVLLGSVESGH